MPNRILKESICTSETVAELSDFEFRLWVGLITQVDDAGRGDARPAIIKGRVFPLRERVTVKDIDNALRGLAAKGCVSLYTVGGRPYLWFPTWSEHQRIRDCKPKYPGPEEQDEKTTCGDLPQVAADCGLNPNPNPNPNPRESRTKRFTPPTVDEVSEYCQKSGYVVDPQRFVDFYASKGWKVGKESMKDWEAAVRNWANRDKKAVTTSGIVSDGEIRKYVQGLDRLKLDS